MYLTLSCKCTRQFTLVDWLGLIRLVNGHVLVEYLGLMASILCLWLACKGGTVKIVGLWIRKGRRLTESIKDLALLFWYTWIPRNNLNCQFSYHLNNCLISPYCDITVAEQNKLVGSSMFIFLTKDKDARIVVVDCSIVQNQSCWFGWSGHELHGQL